MDRKGGRTATGQTLAGLLLALLLAGCERPAQDAADIPHTPIPKVEPRFSLDVREAKIAYRGVVADRATRDGIAAALEGLGATGLVEVDPRRLPAPWAAALGTAAEALRDTGGGLDFAGRRIELRGELDAEQRATLHRRLGRLYPGYTLAGGFAQVDPRLALPEAGDRDALLVFLNAVPPSFHPDSGMLSAAGVDAVARAARGMQAAGHTVVVEAVIHPDSDPGLEREHALGRQRSEALLTQFALRGIAAPRIAVRQGPFVRGREGQVEFAAPAPPVATPQQP